jgi:predicted ATPase/DNA-binding SARP family transcriptional activator
MSRATPTTKAVTPHLHLYLLGSFRLERDTGPIRLPTHKIESLLAFLALHPEEHSREKLAALFWGDSPDTQARGSLRKALTLLRQHLSTDVLITDRETVQVNPAFPIWLDALEFERITHSESVAGSLESEIENLKSQRDFQSDIALYRGDLLSDFYDDWILTEREHYRALYLNTLLQLVQELRAQSEYDRAIEYAHNVLTADPANERAYQHLMFCYVALGNRQAALEQYEQCKRALQEELAVEPSSETTALYQWIRQSRDETRTVAAHLTNLPIPVSSFIGRKREMAEVKESLSLTRLLTLTGAGGSGKTRLAIQVATDLIDAFKEGVWWVELASLMDASLVPHSVAKALGVYELPNQSLGETLANYLRTRHLLLVLDNCEHLIRACAQLTERLLNTCPNLKVLATSREPFGLIGEDVIPVPPLSLPVHQPSLPIANLISFEAIRLFCERARSARHDFALTAEDGPAVEQICQRLDGIPLAIELAAARTRVLSITQIATRLDDRFDLLTTGSCTALPRQQTLRATIDWSYDLLSEKERILLRRVTAFAGGWTLEAVEAVCSGDNIETSQVLDLLTHLVDKSLVIRDEQGGQTRYRLLDTIHEYAREKLGEANEIDQMRSRHLEFFLRLAEKAESELGGPKRMIWFNREETEYDNIRAALESSLTLKDGIVRGLQLASALNEFWVWRSHITEGRNWLDKLRAVSAERGIGSPALRAKVLYTEGGLAMQQTDLPASRELLEQSAALYKEIGDKRGLAHALHWLGLGAGYRNEYGLARSLTGESVALSREAGDKWGLAYALGHYGGCLLNEGDYASARLSLQESLLLFEELGDRWRIEVPLVHIGRLAFQEGDYISARSLFGESMAIDRESDNHWGIAFVLGCLGDLARAQGDYGRAAALYEEGLVLYRTLGVKQRIAAGLLNLGLMATYRDDSDQAINLFTEALGLISADRPDKGELRMIANCLSGFARIHAREGRPHWAARLLGAAEVVREAIRFDPLSQDWRPEYEDTAAAVRARLDETTFAEAWAEGREMRIEQAVELALAPP